MKLTKEETLHLLKYNFVIITRMQQPNVNSPKEKYKYVITKKGDDVNIACAGKHSPTWISNIELSFVSAAELKATNI